MPHRKKKKKKRNILLQPRSTAGFIVLETMKTLEDTAHLTLVRAPAVGTRTWWRCPQGQRWASHAVSLATPCLGLPSAPAPVYHGN